MPLVQKDRAASELRAKADLIRAELADQTKEFSLEEVNARIANITALDARAVQAAGFTPDAEIDSQGGDTAVRRAAPGASNIADDIDRNGVSRRRETAHQRRVRELADAADEHFGGPNSLILALARRSIHPLDTNQQRVINEIEAFSKRTIIGTTSDASGGEFLLPLQQVAKIFSFMPELGGIMDSARRYAVSGRTLRIPYLVQTNNQVTRPMAGFAAVSIVGEGEEKPERQPVFAQRLLTVYKWAAYTELADEMLADDFTGDLSPTVQNVVGGQVVNAINESVTFDGTGSSQPLGAFNNANGALVKVTRTTQNNVSTDDVFEMYARHVRGPNSKWYIHPSVLPELMRLQLSGNTMVTWIQGLQGAPSLQLLGMPVVVTPLVAPLGSQGDVCLGNGDFYALAIRQALTIESSIHYKFRNDVTAFRFHARAGGMPIPTAPYSYKATSSVNDYSVSPFVVLDDLYA